jgi:hypothetical protein
MAVRRHLGLIWFSVLASMGASYPTTNFVVEAPTPQIAQQVGQLAEYYRKEKAMLWLGHEMPSWPHRCPVHVRVTMNGPSGATRFAFDQGQILSRDMQIEGSLDRLLASVLPHEVTHTVFAEYFRMPVPRWADEGGAVLSEDDVERERHDRLVRQVLNTPGRKIPLRRLFSLTQYPGDVMVLYAEGYSVSNYLVGISNRETFLRFVAHGMSAYGWDSAVKSYYHMNRVEELEEAWLAYLRSTKRQPGIFAQNTTPRPAAEPVNRVVVRQTVPPMLPDPAPIYRGQIPAETEATRPALAARPGYLPDVPSAPGQVVQGQVPRDPWRPAGSLSYQPPNPASYQPPVVHLGQPQYAPESAAFTGRSVPGPASPVGYPQ